jgi:riboflavin biosynthesis pyrimidine reductase
MMRLLHPPPTGASTTGQITTAEITIEDAYAAPLGTHADRPWLSLSMVASLDGSTVVAGRSGGLANRNDAAILGRLRSLADVIIVGSGTVRAESYGPPRKRGQRIGVVTGSGRFDPTTELFTSGSGFVITTESTRLDGAAGSIEVIRAGRDGVDLHAALLGLHAIVPNAVTVQAEGGSTLNGSLLAADLVDEINVTTAPFAVGGHGPRLATGDDVEHRYELSQLALDDDGYTFARWRRKVGG